MELKKVGKPNRRYLVFLINRTGRGAKFKRKEMILNRLSQLFLRNTRIVVLISVLSFLIFCIALCYILGDLSLFLQILGSLAGRSLSLLLGKIGFSGGLAFAIGLAVKAILTADGAPSMFMLPYGADAGSEASVNQELHHPSRSGPAAPTPTSASSSAVEQPIPEDKPYIALLQLEGERKRILEEIVHFVEGQLEDPGLPRGPHEQALRFLWWELELDDKSSLAELQYWRGSLRENLRQYQSIFCFYKPGGIYSEGNQPPGYKAH